MLTVVTSTDGQEDLANVDTSDKSVGLAEGTTHTGLQSIGTSARQHLVDTDDVVRVGADAEMEGILSGALDEVLVGANTGGFESLGTQLLILVGDKVDAEGELVDVGALAAEIEDSDLGVFVRSVLASCAFLGWSKSIFTRYTTVEPGLGVRLVLAVAVRDCQYALFSTVCMCELTKGRISRASVLLLNATNEPWTLLSLYPLLFDMVMLLTGSNERDDEPLLRYCPVNRWVYGRKCKVKSAS